MNNINKKIGRGIFALVCLVVGALSLPPSWAASPSSATCDPGKLGTSEMFQCESYTSLPEPSVKSTKSTNELRTSTFHEPQAEPAFSQFFPQHWPQLGFNQKHNPVFSVPPEAPGFLTNGTFWASPLTGFDFLDVGRAYPSVGDVEEWGSTTSQYLGNVLGVSVVKGIAYVQNGRREVWAISARTGAPIWRNEVTTAAGMGQALIEEVNGRLMVFSPVGDAAFTVQNAIDFTFGQPHYRGGNFAGIYAFDALTGEFIWRYAVKGSARPTPVYRDGKLYFNTNNEKFFVLDAASGTELGSLTNPGMGFSGLAAANWYDAPDGRRIIMYGTIRPPRILGVDVTNPAAPTLAWSYTPPGATANAPGDTTAAVDPGLGIMYTTVFTNRGTATAPIFDLNMIALNATTGAVVWSQFMGQGDNPPGYKGSIPMIHDGVVYSGNTLNGTVQAFDAATGTRLWVTTLVGTTTPPDIHRPRAAPVYYEGKIILAEGRDIHTLDAATGAYINRFHTPGIFAVWGINQPVIVGELFIQSSISGWVFGAPVDFITSNPGFGGAPVPPGTINPPPRPPEFLNPAALPTSSQANRFPSTWLAYAGGERHNSVVNQGPGGIAWQTPLKDAFPLSAPPLDEPLYGPEVASHMMHWFVGQGSGVSPSRGIIYAGSDRFSVYALNAYSGDVIWRARTQNANFGQPLVTPRTVVVSAGDPWMNLGSTGLFRMLSPNTRIGDNWPYVRGYHPRTGLEKWTVYTDSGTSANTPLYHNGNLYWVNGHGQVWAVNADTGAKIAPFMDADGLPVLSLGGYNVISSANVYQRAGGSPIMVLGMTMPNRMIAIDLATATVVWTQDLAAQGATYITGFATVPPAVDQQRGLVISTVLMNASYPANTVTQLAFALDANTGAVRWTQAIATGAIPRGGWVGPTPLLDNRKVYLNNPLGNNVVALDIGTGALQWQTPVTTLPGRYSWGPGVVVRNKLIQPVGPYLYTFNVENGNLRNQYNVGGSFTYNHPTVVGRTVYIGNSWGWVLAIPLRDVTQDPGDA